MDSSNELYHLRLAKKAFIGYMFKFNMLGADIREKEIMENL